MNRTELLEKVFEVRSLEELAELVGAIHVGALFNDAMDEIDNYPKAASLLLIGVGNLQAAEHQLKLAAIEMASAKEEN